MDSELIYLDERMNFHRRMARKAIGAEARCAHDALVRAYEGRIEELTRKGHAAGPGTEPGSAPRPILSLSLGK